MDFSTFRSWFDERFSTLLSDKIAEFTSYSASTEVAYIAQYAHDIAQGGKRFRPYLVYQALLPQDPEAHRELFAAVELLHVFALIHDDIMDDGTARHAVTCPHRHFTKRYHHARIGEGVAILLGDLVYQWSYECLLAYCAQHPRVGARLMEIYGELVREVIHGQMIDVISPTQPPFDEALITQKMYLKTARYSFVQPMRLGFAAAGTLDQHHEFAETFGRALGLMFQLQDDLIDVSSEGDKSTFLDIETNQQTILSWYVQSKAGSPDAARFASYLGAPTTPEARKDISQILTDSGARAYVVSLIDGYYADACTCAGETSWRTVADMVYTRTK